MKVKELTVYETDSREVLYTLAQKFNEQLEGQFYDPAVDDSVKLIVHTKNGDVKVHAHWSDELCDFVPKIQERNRVYA